MHPVHVTDNIKRMIPQLNEVQVWKYLCMCNSIFHQGLGLAGG